ncbi:MAG: ComEC/Rec2 family competence protein [Alphaproteobacteria bacterium]|nr:ComEC/Rec2 family competence protein [Alphaproteobacteria bacterium]
MTRWLLKCASFFKKIKQEIEEDTLPFISVFFAAGILTYLKGLSKEPNFLGVFFLCLLLFIGIFIFKKGRVLFLFAFFFFLGIFFTMQRALLKGVPPVNEGYRIVSLTGRIEEISLQPYQKVELLLSQKNEKIRLSFSYKKAPKKSIKKRKRKTFQRLSKEQVNALKEGQIITCRARIKPLYVSSFYENSLFSFFEGVSKEASLVEGFKVLETSKENVFSMAPLRFYVLNKFNRFLSKGTFPIATALILGEQSFIPREIYQTYRDSGVAHILAVSGFHMSFVAGFVFLFLRGFLALFPVVCLYVNTKKIALLGSFLAALFYLLLSGMNIPAMRSFIMLSTFMIAAFFNRKAFSIRNVMIAAFILLWISPESLLKASFQFSFAAVLFLIAGMNWALKKGVFKRRKSFLGKFYNAFLALVLTQIFAGIFTLPYVITYFNKVPFYGLLGNLTLTLGVSFFVLPLLFLSLLPFPFGLEKWIFFMTEKGIALLNQGAMGISLLPSATKYFPPFSTEHLICYTIGGLLFCLLKSKKMGLFLMGIALIYPFSKEQTLAYVSKDLWMVQKGEKLFISSFQKEPKRRDFWQDKKGGASLLLLTEKKVSLQGVSLAFSKEFCQNADIVFALDSNQRCAKGISFSKKDFEKTPQKEVRFCPETKEVRVLPTEGKNRLWDVY